MCKITKMFYNMRCFVMFVTAAYTLLAIQLLQKQKLIIIYSGMLSKVF